MMMTTMTYKKSCLMSEFSTDKSEIFGYTQFFISTRMEFLYHFQLNSREGKNI